MTTEMSTGTIPSDWEEISFSEVVEVNPTRELKKGSVARYVGMADIQPFARRISKSTPMKFRGGSKFKNGDTLFARITPCLENGKTAFVDILADGETGFGSTEFIVLAAREGKTTPQFVYYLSLTPDVRNTAIKSMTGTSGRQRVEYEVFDNIIIQLPPLNEQNRIAKILSDLDSKIELNQQMNRTLEAIAQAIFRHWFVDFEFPNEEGKPYKSSGGEMVYSTELGKEIPKGWKAGKLRQFIDLDKGLSYKGEFLSDEGIPMINLGMIAPGSGFILEGLKHYVGEHKESQLVRVGDIVIANTDITQKREVLGSPAIIPPYLGSETALFTHHIFAVRNKSDLTTSFIYFLLQTTQYRDRVRGFATGTTVLALPRDAILDFSFAVPDDEILKKFDSICFALFQKSSSLIKQNRCLAQVRDSLLPKLMSGKIRVPVEV